MDAGGGIIWSFGGGDQNVVDVAQSRTEIVYAGVRIGAITPTSPPPTPVVVALDPTGREIWRVTLHDSTVFQVMCNGAGDVWAAGDNVTRISPAGAIVWESAGAGASWPGALGPDGTSYWYSSSAVDSQVYLRAIAPDGSSKWTVPLGGNTNGADGAHVTEFGAPAIGPSGRVYVPCWPCQGGQVGVAGVDSVSGGVVEIAPTDPGDAGAVPNTVHGVTTDGTENIYYGFGVDLASSPLLASADSTGMLRWTTAVVAVGEARTRFPALVGIRSLWANGPNGLLELSPTDGTVLSQVPMSTVHSVTALLGGGRRLAEMEFRPADAGIVSPASDTFGVVVLDSNDNVLWSDPTMSASAIPASGAVYGIEQDPTTRLGTLVRIRAPVEGLEFGAWPMVRHDPGRTSSAAGSW